MMGMVKRFCLVPRLSGVGGMVSFQHKLAAGLAARGVELCYDLEDTPYQAALVIGGTRQLGGLWRARRQGARVVQRLDGMNWLHRLRRTGLRHYLRAEYGNLLLRWIRSQQADAIVYQSEFSRGWWERVYGVTRAPNTVIVNGVDLNVFTPQGPSGRPEDCWRLLLVEGSLMGGYEMGLEVSVELAATLSRRLSSSHSLSSQKRVELMVAGRVSPDVRQLWEQRAGSLPIRWAGLLPQEQIPFLDRSAHLLYSADVNAACPNSVIEALACGLPVLAFDTGALPELVRGDAGRVVPYGSNPWKLEPPDVSALADGALEILQGGDRLRSASRERAESAFGLDKMVEEYYQFLVG